MAMAGTTAKRVKGQIDAVSVGGATHTREAAGAAKA